MYFPIDKTSFAGQPGGISRRSFLKMSGMSGLAIGLFPQLGLAAASPADSALKATQLPAAFLQIGRDGAITITINRLDFGQGVQTALPMILAEELDADWAAVHSVHGSNAPAYADPAFGIHITGGSSSIKNSFVQYRELGARARAMLLQAAADQWQTTPAGLSAGNSRVRHPDGRELSYGELAERAMSLPVPQTVSLKDPAQFRLIGRPTGRLDATAKSTGRQRYGIDQRQTDMLTAVVAHPPVFGARIAELDLRDAQAIRGVKHIARITLERGAEGVAVIADGYWPALQARNALKISWDSSQCEKVDSAKQLAQYRGMLTEAGPRYFKDDISGLAKARHQIKAEFHFPYLAHAPMEPLNCTVALHADRAELWLGTQMPGLDGLAAAKIFGLPPEQVSVHAQMAGGGFGRRAVPSSDYVCEAARVAKAAYAAGLTQPVRTVWSREDDIHGGYYRPMHLHSARIGFDEHGKILGWEHVIVGQSITAGSPFENMMVKNGIDQTAVEGMKEPYQLPMQLTVHHPKVNVPVLWWRSVGSTHTAFAMETLIDEIAVTCKLDPVAYRLQLIGDAHPRHRAALQLAVEHAGYGKKKLPAGQAYGVAVHESFNTVVAYVVVASYSKGRPRLLKVTAGVHCNLAVNPATIEAQVQGAALMGLGTCLPGAAITLKDGVVEQNNFGEYTVARITDMPQIDVHIVPSADPPTGIGEPGLPPLAPAYANALARLTGKRQRALPFRDL